MKLLIIFALISFAAAAQDPTCTQMAKDTEASLHKIFVLEGDKIPSAAEVKERCESAKKLYKGLLDYKRCLSGLSKEIFNNAQQSILKLLKKNCGTDEGRAALVAVLQCVPAPKLKQVQACTVGTLDVLGRLADSNESKANLLPKVCCLGQISLDCVRTRLAGVKCNNINPIAHLEEIVGGLQKDVTEIVCQGLETMQACQAKIPAEVSKMKATIHGNTDSNLARTKLIEPLLKVAAKIAN